MNEIKICTIKDIDTVLEFAYKAVYERGWVDTDFDKISFNFRVKSILVQGNCKTFGMFRENKMVGIAVAQIDTAPWNTKLRCNMDLVHLDFEHRNPDYYQLLFQSVLDYCETHNIKTIRTSSTSYLLSASDRVEFLNDNGFREVDTAWERYED